MMLKLAKKVSILLFLGLVFSFASPVFAHSFLDAPAGAHTPLTKSFTYTLSAINPTAQTNPAGATVPGARGENQMVIYTTAAGPNSGTNNAGLEVIVMGGVAKRVEPGNSIIPANGFVVSGHGQAAHWLRKILKPGSQVQIDSTQMRLSVTHTPMVYLQEVDQALELLNVSDASQSAAQARQCRNQLHQASTGPLTQNLIHQAQSCLSLANRAFYQQIETRPNEFRGIWVRPQRQSQEQIRRMVTELKQLNIDHIFLETYYQGKTIYPSEVMTSYGLPEQHAQFEGTDPLSLWIEEAHQQGIFVHAWTQVFFAGNKDENVEKHGPILKKYPQWRNIQRTAIYYAEPIPSNIEPGHYFIDPANSEAREFAEKLLLEIVDNYSVDGLNLDYIRYPASASLKYPSYLATTWGYTPAAREAFQTMIHNEIKADLERQKAEEAKKIEEAKKQGRIIPPSKPVDLKAVLDKVKADPKDLTLDSPFWPKWVNWRKDQVTSFVQTISQKAHALKPNLQVTAVVFPQTDPQFAVKSQDWPKWVKEGYVQALTPIGLQSSPEGMYQDSLRFKQLTENKVPVYVGIFSMYNREDPVEFVSQIDAVHRAGLSGIMLFEASRLSPEYKEALSAGPFRQ